MSRKPCDVRSDREWDWGVWLQVTTWVEVTEFCFCVVRRLGSIQGIVAAPALLMTKKKQDRQTKQPWRQKKKEVELVAADGEPD